MNLNTKQHLQDIGLDDDLIRQIEEMGEPFTAQSDPVKHKRLVELMDQVTEEIYNILQI